jgi:hypothetical protein
MSKAAELAKAGETLTNQPSGRKNIVTNGAMQVAQRSTSETGLGAAAGYFTLDRYKIETASSAGRLTMTQTADGPSGFANCLKLDCTTADTSIHADEYLFLRQKFEGQDLQQLKKGTSDAESVTVSFYVKGDQAATYVCELKDNDNSRNNTQAFAVTTSWNRIELTFAADTTGALDDDNASSFEINIWLHAGSGYTGGTFASNTWASVTNANRYAGSRTSFYDSTDREFFLTGVQMEIGSQATNFEHRSFGEELALCQRYYYRIQGNGSATTSLGIGFASTTTTAYSYLKFPVNMRAAPSLDGSSGLTASDLNSYTVAYASVAVNATESSSHGSSGTYIIVTVSSGLTALRVNANQLTANAGSFLALSAEL